MELGRNVARIIFTGLLAFSVAGCATARDRKTDNTLIGAGLGAAAGAVISKGDPLYTVGGAAAGGLLGNILTSEPRYERRGPRHHYRSMPPGQAKKHYRHVQKKHHRQGRHHHRHRR